jgi:hypothetical protein
MHCKVFAREQEPEANLGVGCLGLPQGAGVLFLPTKREKVAIGKEHRPSQRVGLKLPVFAPEEPAGRKLGVGGPSCRLIARAFSFRGQQPLPARIEMLQAERRQASLVYGKQRAPLGQAQAEERPITVFVYVNTSKQVGDPEHIKVFATADAAETWFEETTPKVCVRIRGNRP